MERNHVTEIKNNKEEVPLQFYLERFPEIDPEERAEAEDFRILLMPDHYTLLRTQTHDGTPVPYAIYDSRRPGAPRVFCEDACADKPVLASGVALLKRLFEME